MRFFPLHTNSPFSGSPLFLPVSLWAKQWHPSFEANILYRFNCWVVCHYPMNSLPCLMVFCLQFLPKKRDFFPILHRKSWISKKNTREGRRRGIKERRDWGKCVCTMYKDQQDDFFPYTNAPMTKVHPCSRTFHCWGESMRGLSSRKVGEH